MAQVTAKDASNNTFVLYGVNNVTGVDNRMTWEAAAVTCGLIKGSLANLTNTNAGFLGSLFSYYKSSVTGGATQWGNRRTCAWVGLTNLVSNYTLISSLTVAPTSELFWAEDAGAQCGAVSRAAFCISVRIFSVASFYPRMSRLNLGLR